MNKGYTVEKGQLILISLLKKSGIKRIIASPGTTNITFVASLMNDPYFEIYSAADERSAAYMACGMAIETKEPVVLTCTGATASRNYIPAMTEAFYRKLPILAVTATQNINKVGHLVPQVIDRSHQISDTYVHSVQIAVPRDKDDEWDATIKLNRAILALKHHGGGPVHINLSTNYTRDFSVQELPDVVKINRYTPLDKLPDIPAGRVGIRVGNHCSFSKAETDAIEEFCVKYGAVVFCEACSNYAGEHRVFAALSSHQGYRKDIFATDVLIHIGETASYGADSTACTKQVWRVSEDGELRDLMRKLSNVFEMPEIYFFKQYTAKPDPYSATRDFDYLKKCIVDYNDIHTSVPELPFSNVWIAQQTAEKLPEDSILHLGILHSQRCWSLFDAKGELRNHTFVNTGGFGIDGCLSTVIGGSIANPEKLHFIVIGDLAFFYDMNSLGNHNIGNNLRILLINNGCGTEFKNYNHFAASFGNDANEYMAAAGHYGNRSPQLVRHYAQDLGFKYLSATNKEEYLNALTEFITSDKCDRPILFEVFTNPEDESEAIKIANTLRIYTPTTNEIIKAKVYSSTIGSVKKIFGKS